MRADGNISQGAARSPDPVATPAATHKGRPGPLAEAMEWARTGKPAQALEILDALLPTDRRIPSTEANIDLEQAVVLKARCLIDLKSHSDCRLFLDMARGRGWISLLHPGLQVAELHLMLFDEEYGPVQDAASALLNVITNHADPLHAELRLILGAAQRWLGNPKDSIGNVEFAHAAFTVLDEPERAAVAGNFLGWSHLSAGRLEESRRWFEKSLAIHEELGAPLRMAQTYQNLAIVCYKQGDYTVCEELLNRELDLVAEHPDMVCRARIALGNVLRLEGDNLAARSCLLEAYSLATGQSLSREEALSLEFLGDVFRDEGNPSEARRYYQRALGVARSLAPRGDLVMELKRRQGECLDMEGNHPDAQAILNEALEIGRAVDDRFEIAIIHRCLGVNAANLGRWKLACEHLEQSLVTLLGMRARHEAMLSAWQLARTLLRRIDTGNFGPVTAKALESAWIAALQAQQLLQELETTLLSREIPELIEQISRRRQMRSSPPPLQPSFSSRRVPATRVVAVSPLFRQVLQRCDGFSRYKNPVLLQGENGSGKELLARRIHETSPRGSAPLIQINCAAAAPEVLAREIFGVAAGATPHVKRSLPGLVAQAEDGTLLLQGIEDLPRELQGTVLRLIQEGIYRPVGDAREHQANVRILATAETDLASLADKGFFRQDLYFRLKQMSVQVPPLRRRTEDVVPLLDHFLTRLNGSTLTARDLLDLPGIEALTEHHWPGNTAELEAVAQQVWLNRDLGRPFRLRSRNTPGGGTLELLEEKESRAAADTRDHQSGMTWTSLNALLERAGGNKAQVARNLGISRITLYRWLEQLSPGFDQGS